MPQSNFARFLLTIVNRSTRWFEATSMSEATTHAYDKALLLSWISLFGVHDDITTDRGSSFWSEILLSLANLMGTSLHSTTEYNSAANGMFERTLRTLKAALMVRYMDEHWKAQLPWVLLCLHTAPRADGKPYTAEKIYGEAIAVPKEFFPATTDDTKLNHLRKIAGKFRPCLEIYKGRTRHFLPKNLDDCDTSLSGSTITTNPGLDLIAALTRSSEEQPNLSSVMSTDKNIG
ncbi:uncharacterized protein [Palaemon carinicauda]|uniref:uncharacterized protein n=1 Tax=Palaemon carinicauda TaxID=392227 RepID=UPI0035B5C516